MPVSGFSDLTSCIASIARLAKNSASRPKIFDESVVFAMLKATSRPRVAVARERAVARAGKGRALRHAREALATAAARHPWQHQLGRAAHVRVDACAHLLVAIDVVRLVDENRGERRQRLARR